MDKFVRRMKALTYNHSEALNPGVMMRPSKVPNTQAEDGQKDTDFHAIKEQGLTRAAGQSSVSPNAERHEFALHLGVPVSRFENWAIYQQLCQKHLSFVLFLFYVEQNKDQELFRNPFRSLWQNIANWKTYQRHK